MAPFHCFYLGSSGGKRFVCHFSVLHGPISLLSSRVFWKQTLCLPFFSASWPHITAFILVLLEANTLFVIFQCFMVPYHCFHLGSSGGKQFICHFHCFMAPFHCNQIGSSGGYTLYLLFSVPHGIPLYSSRW